MNLQQIAGLIGKALLIFGVLMAFRYFRGIELTSEYVLGKAVWMLPLIILVYISIDWLRGKRKKRDA